MEDLKENTQKKIMEKLVLSAALGMFCYCSNNASRQAPTEPVKENNINEETNPNQNEGEIQKGEDLLQPNQKNSITSTKEEKQGEECCPCCCCHNKESEGEKEQPKENETNPSNKKPNEIQLDTIKEEEQK